MRLIDAKKLKWKHSGKCRKSRKHALKISPRFIALGKSFAVKFIKICRYKTFWMRIFVRGIFLLFRSCSIHVKLCVLLKYSARNCEFKNCGDLGSDNKLQRYHPWAVGLLIHDSLNLNVEPLNPENLSSHCLFTCQHDYINMLNLN